MEHTEDEMIRCGETDCKYNGRNGKCEADAKLEDALMVPTKNGLLLLCDRFIPKIETWEYKAVIRRAIEE